MCAQIKSKVQKNHTKVLTYEILVVNIEVQVIHTKEVIPNEKLEFNYC